MNEWVTIDGKMIDVSNYPGGSNGFWNDISRARQRQIELIEQKLNKSTAGKVLNQHQATQSKNLLEWLLRR